MSKREDAFKRLQELVQADPGFEADFYIARAALDLGLSRKRMSRCLKMLQVTRHAHIDT